MTESTQLKKHNDQTAASAKERISECALHLFCKKGYDATSVREIVEAAGVTKPVLYYYFKNKEDLLAKILQETLGGYTVRIEAICTQTNENVLGILRQLVDLYREVAKNKPEIVRLINSICYSGIYDEIFDFSAFMDNLTGLVASVLQRAKENGQLRSDMEVHTIASHFLGMLSHGMDYMVYKPEQELGEELLDSVLPLLLDGAISSNNGQNL